MLSKGICLKLKNKRIILSAQHVLFLSIGLFLFLVIVALEAFHFGIRNQKRLAGNQVPVAVRAPSSVALDAGQSTGVDDYYILKNELKGIKGPMDNLIEALEEMRYNALTSMPFTRLRYHRGVDRSKTVLVVIPRADVANCMRLVNSIFDNARNKNQIRVAMIETDEHVNESNVDRDVIFISSKCVDHKYKACNQSKFCPTDHIRRRRVPESELKALGRSISWLRHLGTMMYRNERYLLMVDGAVSNFAPDWDEKLIKDYKDRVKAVQSEGGKVVLSGRVPMKRENYFSPVCIDHIDELGVPVLASTTRQAAPNAEPKLSFNLPQPLATSEFLFVDGNLFLEEVPFDRYMYSLSTSGSDFLLSARLEGAGFSIFLPKEPLVFVKSEEKDNNSTLAIYSETASKTKSSKESVERFYDVLTNPKKIKDKRYVIDGINSILAKSDGTYDLKKFFKLTGVDLVSKKLKYYGSKSVLCQGTEQK